MLDICTTKSSIRKLATSIKKLLFSKMSVLVWLTCFIPTFGFAWPKHSNFKGKPRLVKKSLLSSVTSTPTANICRGSTVVLGDIEITEDANDNFAGTGTLRLSFGNGFTLGGTVSVTLDGNAPSTGSGFGFTTSFTNSGKTLSITYSFSAPTTTKKNTITISGLDVTAGNGASNKTVVSGGDFGNLGLANANETLATINVLPKPAIPSNSYGPSSLFVGETAVFSVSSVSGATEYEWAVPAEFDGGATQSTNAPFIVLTANSPVATTTLQVRAKNSAGCFGDYKDYIVSISTTGLEVNNQTTNICNDGSVVTLPDIVLTEKILC